MRVLVACERSNTVRDAFLRRGHDAWSCDMERAEHPNPNWRRHIRGDVRPLLREPWDMVIAHPPCTYLCIGSQGLWPAGMPAHRAPRYRDMTAAVEFFLACLGANAPRVCVENPRPHTHARHLLPGWTQVIEPYQFGHPYTKATCLWLRGLPELVATEVVAPVGPHVVGGFGRGQRTESDRSARGVGLERHRSRAYLHSRTFTGIARAMAEQWG